MVVKTILSILVIFPFFMIIKFITCSCTYLISMCFEDYHIKLCDINNNAWVTVKNDFFGHEWGYLPMIFTSDEVTSENHWQITSWVTKKSLFTVTNVLVYFLHAILYLEHTVPLQTIIDRSFRHCHQGRSFLTKHCDVITVDLWCHANARHWHCDVIFVNCSCTRKLVQRRSSLVNNNREYRFLTTRYSRLSV